ncbi:MAG: cob(I)yrinic acid a,c-diamide adenosyltransferase [Eubacteriales bacterium]|nr:cob(I)yrinic acid a,c-diamide adenosyltransferase [Eubacteriales bacterium]
MKTQKGCIHIYCGDGKGKTSAGMGLCIRAAGRGKRVLIYQFLKDNSTGEIRSLSHLPNVTRLNGPDNVKFSFQMTPAEREETIQHYRMLLKDLFARSTEYDLLFLDESVYAVASGLIAEEELISCLIHRPSHLEVILTGQNPSDTLLRHADYVSHICKIKHPFDRGQPSREGIEF